MGSETATEPDFVIAVVSIASGWIEADFRVGPHHLELWMDNVSVVPEDLACWVLALKRGEPAQLTFQWEDPILTGWPVPGNLVRLSASRRLFDGVVENVFDCLVGIEQATAGVRRFLQVVAQHPHMASAWLHWEDVPVALDDAAMVHVRATSAAGSPDKLDPSAIEAYYIAERMPFTLEQQSEIDRYRAKLAAAADSLR